MNDLHQMFLQPVAFCNSSYCLIKSRLIHNKTKIQAKTKKIINISQRQPPTARNGGIFFLNTGTGTGVKKYPAHHTYSAHLLI
jgi:hypothetical protein